MTNIILSTDLYKASHYLLYPDGTEYVYSYIESRGGKYDKIVFLGIQEFKKKYLTHPITADDIDEAEDIITTAGLPFNREGWEYILRVHQGYLPLKIKSIKEGTVLKTKNVLVTVVNTDPKCAWLTNYIESPLLRSIWYATTVATGSFNIKVELLKSYAQSSDTVVTPVLSDLSFKLNDFGVRGVSSKESAEIGGIGHLINFAGTDNMEALLAIKKIYNKTKVGFSIPAYEHSTVTSWGRDKEALSYTRGLEKFAHSGSLLAVVSDSYDLWNAVTEIWGKQLKEKLLASGATIIIRPDSGDALTVPIKIIEILGEIFGYTTNSKGYKVLHPSVRVIQGDGITQESVPIILKNLMNAGYSIDNLALGMGGGLLQMVNRDDLKFAMKCSAISINGIWHNVRKEPITDPGKRSKAGRLALVEIDPVAGLPNYVTVPFDGHNELDVLEDVFIDGVHLNDESWDSIVERVHKMALAYAL